MPVIIGILLEIVALVMSPFNPDLAGLLCLTVPVVCITIIVY